MTYVLRPKNSSKLCGQRGTNLSFLSRIILHLAWEHDNGRLLRIYIITIFLRSTRGPSPRTWFIKLQLNNLEHFIAQLKFLTFTSQGCVSSSSYSNLELLSYLMRDTLAPCHGKSHFWNFITIFNGS